MKTLAEALNRAGSRAEAIELPGIGHTGIVAAIARPLRWRAPVLEHMTAFIKSPLAPAKDSVTP